MAKFELTDHARKRMKEREVLDPNGLLLINAGRKTRRRIRESCKSMGCDNKEYVYLATRHLHTHNKNPISVYICKAIDIGKYIVITVFKYK